MLTRLETWERLTLRNDIEDKRRGRKKDVKVDEVGHVAKDGIMSPTRYIIAVKK